MEKHDLADTAPNRVASLKARLETYIAKAATPLNMYSCSKKKGPGCRGVDPDAVKARNAADSWVVWH